MPCFAGTDLPPKNLILTYYFVFPLTEQWILGVSAEFPELENIPGSQISLTEASHLQSSATSVNALCHCKSGCINTDVHVEEQELSLSFPRNCTNNDVWVRGIVIK